MNTVQRGYSPQDTGLGARGADRERAKDLPLLSLWAAATSTASRTSGAKRSGTGGGPGIGKVSDLLYCVARWPPSSPQGPRPLQSCSAAARVALATPPPPINPG